MEKDFKAPSTWNDLLDIDDVPKLSESDLQCLNEIREVILRNGKDKTFGVSLLHKHFDLQEDEVLFETQDLSKRTLTLTARKLSDIRDMRAVPTSWRFDNNSILSYTQCATGMYGAHYGYRDD